MNHLEQFEGSIDLLKEVVKGEFKATTFDLDASENLLAMHNINKEEKTEPNKEQKLRKIFDFDFLTVFKSKLSQYVACSFGFIFDNENKEDISFKYFVRIENTYMSRQNLFNSTQFTAKELQDKINKVIQKLSQLKQKTREEILMSINEEFLNPNIVNLSKSMVLQPNINLKLDCPRTKALKS